MYCVRCGKNIGPDAVFCQYCGTRQSVVGSTDPTTGSVTYAVPNAPPKKLRRSRANRKIAGLCAGVADYLDLDPTLIRVIWLLCVLLGGTGVLAYLIGWIAVPEE